MKFDRPTLVTLTAPTASGKSYLLDHLTKPDTWSYDLALTTGKTYDFEPMFSRIVSTTTRPQRVGEMQGHDYDYISMSKSLLMEKAGEFAELIEFRGVRYGVTKAEMEGKIAGALPPVVVLEPKGLQIYENLCFENGWEIFKIFVNTPEPLRIKRLNERTSIDVRNAVIDTAKLNTDGRIGYTMAALNAAEKIINVHTDRLLSITGEERSWRNTNTWDVLVPGDNVEQAKADIIKGIEWRNYRNRTLNVDKPPTVGAHDGS